MLWNSPTSQTSQTRSFLKNSRLSDNSTEIDRSFKLGNSFELESSIINSHKHNNSRVIRQNIGQGGEKREGRVQNEGEREYVKRKYLSSILINRMLNVRQALKAFQSVPTKIFNQSPSFKMAQQILIKSKINIEISVLRTLLFSHENKSSDICKLKHTRGGNVFILATPNKVNDASRQEQIIRDQRLGIEKVVSIVNERIGHGLESIRKYCVEEVALVRYFNKVCTNHNSSVVAAFNKMKGLPGKGLNNKAKSQLIDKQIKILGLIFMKRQSTLLVQSMERLKDYCEKQRYYYRFAAKQMICFAKLRKEQCLRQWVHLSMKAKKEQEVCEQKKDVLTRIVLRNYLKLFGQIIRRLSNCRKVAKRIGCGSKINEQKSLWRLRVNAQRSSRK